MDSERWRQGKAIDYTPLKTSAISLKSLKAALEAQGTEFQFGDILIVCSGWFQQVKLAKGPKLTFEPRVSGSISKIRPGWGHRSHEEQSTRSWWSGAGR